MPIITDRGLAALEGPCLLGGQADATRRAHGPLHGQYDRELATLSGTQIAWPDLRGLILCTRLAEELFPPRCLGQIRVLKPQEWAPLALDGQAQMTGRNPGQPRHDAIRSAEQLPQLWLLG